MYLNEIKQPESMKNVIDLGSGTGVLTLIAKQANIGGKYVTIDSLPEAKECSEMNCQIYGH